MPSDNASQTAKKAKKMLALALSESLEAPRENETIVLPGYSIKETLGKGGMSTVYRAVQKKLNRVVALKIFSPKAEDKDLFVERLKREGKLMAQLKHPNVISIHDASVMEDGTPYLVLEYIKGEDLHKKLQNAKTLKHRTAIRIAIKVCDALSAVHKLGIIHRDIKPANVLLGSNGSVKVTDFGISKDLRANDKNTSLTMTGTTVGTIDYMSPEQTRNEPLSPRSDLYSVGVLLYEMLMGVTPRGNFQPLKKAKIPRKLEYIIMRCLQQDENKRPASADTLALSLRKIYLNLSTRKHTNYKTIIICGIAAVSSIGLVTYISTNKNNTHEEEPNKPRWKLHGEIDQWSPLTNDPTHTITGEWWSDDNNLYTQQNQYAKRFFTFSAGYNYIFSTQFTRIYGDGNMCIFLPTIKGLAVFELDYTDQNLTGFQSINGQTLTEQPEYNFKTIPIIDNKNYDIKITITTKTITASINGIDIAFLSLSDNTFTPPDHWQKPLPFRLGLGAHCQAIFRNTQVKRIK